MSAVKVVALGLALTWSSAALAEPQIDEVQVRVLSHVDGKTYELDKLPQDDGGSYEYGGDMDLLVGIAVSGTGTKAKDLTVELKTPGFSSEATGTVKAIKLKQKRKVFVGGEGAKRWYFFVFDRTCDKSTFTAKLGSSTKVVSHDLFCAE